MTVKSFFLTMGAGVAVGALGAMMLPKNSDAYRMTKQAAKAIQSEAEKAVDAISSATTKRRTAGATSASSSAISRRSGSTGSRKWRTRSWSSCIRRNSAGTRRNSWPGRRRRHSPSGHRIGG